MKIAPYVLFSLLILVISTTSCGKKTNLQAATNQNTMDSLRQEELFVWVENARIREAADLSAAVITEIKGGEKLTLTGETSTNKIKVKLRGVDFEDVWVKVKTVDGKEGWIFKAMLTDNEEMASAMNDFLIVPGESVGRVRVGAKQAELESIFGKEFIIEGVIYDGQGVEWPGFYIFKNSPLELKCILNESENTIDRVVISEPGSNWQTAEGIKIGTTIDELVKMNGKPISFDCFGSEYGAWIQGYNKGKLSSYVGKTGICLGEPDDLTSLDDFMVEGECSSANKAIFGKGVRVAEIVIYPPIIM